MGWVRLPTTFGGKRIPEISRRGKLSAGFWGGWIYKARIVLT
jgi:hypothetical protein